MDEFRERSSIKHSKDALRARFASQAVQTLHMPATIMSISMEISGNLVSPSVVIP
jgi:hypothetical protein